MLNLIGLLLILALTGAGALLPSYYVLAPMRLLKPARRTRWQVRVADYLSLFVVVQYAMGLISAAWRIDVTIGVITAMYSLATMIGLWFVGVRTLTDARIDDSYRRLAFLSVVLPAVAATSLAYVPIVLIVGVQVVDGTLAWQTWPLLWLVLVPLGIYGCRKLVDWIAKERLRSLEDRAEAGPFSIERAQHTIR